MSEAGVRKSYVDTSGGQIHVRSMAGAKAGAKGASAGASAGRMLGSAIGGMNEQERIMGAGALLAGLMVGISVLAGRR